MAEGGIDFTTCSVCLDTFKKPRMLIACGHTFCSDCLETLINNGRRECPDCREVIPNQSVESFPINYVAVSAIGSSDNHSQRPSANDNCVTHNMPKLTYCRGPNCMVAICMECWQIDHKTPPHEVVPLETELKLMRTAAAKNTNTVLDFQSSVKPLMKQLSEARLKGRELFEGTELLVAYQLKATSEESLLRLKNYNEEMLKLCQLKQTEMQTIDEEVKLITKASTNARKQLDNLMSRVQQDNSPTVADKQHPKEPAEPAALASRELARVREVVGKTNEDLGLQNDSVVLAAAGSITSREIFIALIESQTIHVFNFNLCPLYSFTIKSGEIRRIAVSGDGTLYVSYCRQGERTVVTSAVGNTSGRILRNIHSSDMRIHRMRAFGNRLVIIYYRYETPEDTHLFVFDNETLIRSIELFNIVCPEIFSHSYMMCEKLVGSEWHLMLINIDSSSSSESQHKRIQLETENRFSRPFWIPKPSEVNTNTVDGYFVIDQIEQDNKLKVYETDLDNVEDGAKLQSRQIPLTSNEYSHIWFLSALGDNLVLCELKKKYEACKIAVLRFEFN